MKPGPALIVALWAFSGVALCQSSFDQAMELFRQRQWSDAAQAFAEVERAQPGQTDALLQSGKCLVNLGRFAEAGGALEAFVARNPRSQDGLYLLGYVRFRQDQPKESLELLTRAAALKPPSADDLKIAALDYVLLQDYGSAGKYLEEALKLEPDSIEARYHLGRVRYQQNRFDEAIAAFEEVLKREPGHAKAEDNLGLSLEARNDTEGAIRAYRAAIRMEENSLNRSEQPYLNLGILLTRLNRTKEAVDVLQQAAQIDPQSPKTRRELGKTYLQAGRDTDAEKELSRAIELDPADSSAHYLLGRVYRHLGKPDLAEREFKTTEELMRSQRAKTGGMGMSSGVER